MLVGYALVHPLLLRRGTFIVASTRVTRQRQEGDQLRDLLPRKGRFVERPQPLVQSRCLLRSQQGKPPRQPEVVARRNRDQRAPRIRRRRQVRGRRKREVRVQGGQGRRLDRRRRTMMTLTLGRALAAVKVMDEVDGWMDDDDEYDSVSRKNIHQSSSRQIIKKFPTNIKEYLYLSMLCI